MILCMTVALSWLTDDCQIQSCFFLVFLFSAAFQAQAVRSAVASALQRVILLDEPEAIRFLVVFDSVQMGPVMMQMVGSSEESNALMRVHTAAPSLLSAMHRPCGFYRGTA